jgi:uncharacterized DUF497 family protein
MYIQTYSNGRVSSWGRRKGEANFVDRGFDFEFASSIFTGPTLEREDTRQDYGERRASKRERVVYEAAIEGKDSKSWPRGP